jgi:competence protein ComEC
MIVAAVLAAFVGGAWLLQQQAALPGPVQHAGLAAGAVGLGLWSIRHGRRDPVPHGVLPAAALAGLLLSAVVLGAAYAALRAQIRLADELAWSSQGLDVRLIGVVASLPARLERGVRFDFDVQAVLAPRLAVPSRISLAWYGQDAGVRPGERWEFVVRLRRPHGTLNPGGFDLEAWMLERGLRAGGYVRPDGRTQHERTAILRDPLVRQPAYLVDRARDALREDLQRLLAGRRYAGVLVALVLGDQRAITEADWLLFNRTGISHLVSISGLHITMIAGLAAALTRVLWRRSQRALALAPAQSAAAAGAVVAALGYCLLAGWGVPAQRTFFMLGSIAVALWLRVVTSAATTLALAAFVVTLLDPWAVLSAGFWLSFGAVAAIFHVVQGRPPRGRQWRARLGEAARLQLAVTVALVPLTIVLFQQVSVISPLANAIAIPVVSLLVTPLALGGAGLVMLPEPAAALARLPLLAAHALLSPLFELLRWTLSWPMASVVVAAPPAWAAALGVAGAAWVLAPPGWPVRTAGCVWMLPLFVWPAVRPTQGELWVTALDVGQGMAVLLESADRTVLYDTGPRYSPQSSAASRIVLPYLRYRGLDRLDLLVISHRDGDHAGGADALAAAGAVDRVLTSVERRDLPFGAGIPVERCEAGNVVDLGSMTLDVLHPSGDDYRAAGRNANAVSCVIAARVGAHRVLLTGDVLKAQESTLLARAPGLGATLLSAPHHGSASSSSEPFVRAVAPRWVVVQAGYRNRFGHPHPSVVERYRAAGARVVRSDAAGATQWRLRPDGSAWVRSERIHGRRYWHNLPAGDAPLPADEQDPPAAHGMPDAGDAAARFE